MDNIGALQYGFVAPSQERELKFGTPGRLRPRLTVAPSQERELKSRVAGEHLLEENVAPSQERELKYRRPLLISGEILSLLHRSVS